MARSALRGSGGTRLRSGLARKRRKQLRHRFQQRLLARPMPAPPAPFAAIAVAVPVLAVALGICLAGRLLLHKCKRTRRQPLQLRSLAAAAVGSGGIQQRSGSGKRSGNRLAIIVGLRCSAEGFQSACNRLRALRPCCGGALARRRRRSGARRQGGVRLAAHRLVEIPIPTVPQAKRRTQIASSSELCHDISLNTRAPAGREAYLATPLLWAAQDSSDPFSSRLV